MGRLVLPAALEVIAIGLGDLDPEVPLLLDVELEVQEGVVHRTAALLDGPHQGDLTWPELVEDGLDLGGLQPRLEVVEHRVVRMIEGSEELRVLAAELEHLLEVRSEGGEVVGRA